MQITHTEDTTRRKYRQLVSHWIESNHANLVIQFVKRVAFILPGRTVPTKPLSLTLAIGHNAKGVCNHRKILLKHPLCRWLYRPYPPLLYNQTGGAQRNEAGEAALLHHWAMSVHRNGHFCLGQLVAGKSFDSHSQFPLRVDILEAYFNVNVCAFVH
ncbi:unnamed protein product [Protopolystoma xenopodis]|uniref:Uncharacterized protein n=1 Tax=Protopolystoma xenopodis TaxID=117903 RepID=A0A3S5A0M9_9PLAT|nr:unnamed protein product [Protopolystoma xenopodis]